MRSRRTKSFTCLAKSVTALGPPGFDHFMVLMTETPRDFSTLALPAEYVSQAGPFEKFQGTASAAAHVGQVAHCPLLPSRVIAEARNASATWESLGAVRTYSVQACSRPKKSSEYEAIESCDSRAEFSMHFTALPPARALPALSHAHALYK